MRFIMLSWCILAPIKGRTEEQSPQIFSMKLADPRECISNYAWFVSNSNSKRYLTLNRNRIRFVYKYAIPIKLLAVNLLN